MLQRFRREYLSLTALWLSVHALPLVWLTGGRYCHFEVIQARKFLDYGFWARKGAILYNQWNAGMLPNPADHNYVNHPYPIFWFYTFLYWLFGQVGIYTFVALSGLAWCLVTYWFLKQYFPVRVAWFTAALVTFAHATVEFSTNPDVLAQSAVVWPLAVLALARMKPGGLAPRPWASAALGLVVFLSGQINWFALTTVPVVLLLCLPEKMPLGQALRRPWSVPGWMPVLVGGTASFAVFLGQVFAYSPSLHNNASYLFQTQMGVGGGFISSRVTKMPVLLLRLLLVGPALWLGALVCLTQLRKSLPQRRLVLIVMAYLPIFGLVMLAIPTILYLNQHAFRFNLFPCAVMTAFALTCLDAKWLRATLAGLAFACLLLCYAKLHDYQASMAATTLGHWLRPQTRPEELVLTNLKYSQPPLQPWDAEFVSSVGHIADRLTFFAPDPESLQQYAQGFGGHLAGAVFLKENSQSIDAALERTLDTEATAVLTTNLAFPKDGLPVFKTGRAMLYYALKLNNAPPPIRAGAETNVLHLTLYRFSPALIEKLNAVCSTNVVNPGLPDLKPRAGEF